MNLLIFAIDKYMQNLKGNWLATADTAKREMKRRMKERYGNAKDALEELVNAPAGYQTIGERLSNLKIYLKSA